MENPLEEVPSGSSIEKKLGSTSSDRALPKTLICERTKYWYFVTVLILPRVLTRVSILVQVVRKVLILWFPIQVQTCRTIGKTFKIKQSLFKTGDASQSAPNTLISAYSRVSQAREMWNVKCAFFSSILILCLFAWLRVCAGTRVSHTKHSKPMPCIALK